MPLRLLKNKKFYLSKRQIYYYKFEKKKKKDCKGGHATPLGKLSPKPKGGSAK
jgi:hypothetical protein